MPTRHVSVVIFVVIALAFFAAVATVTFDGDEEDPPDVEYPGGTVIRDGTIYFPGGLELCSDGSYYAPEGVNASLAGLPMPAIKRDRPC